MAALLLSFGACSSDDKGEAVKPEGNEVVFKSAIKEAVEGEAVSRVIESSWDEDDQVGIYMLYADQELSPNNVVDGYSNKRYGANGGSDLLPIEGAMLFPEDGTNVDFVAYFPYNNVVVNDLFVVDIRNQEEQESLDVLYSNNAKGYSNDGKGVELYFKRQMSKLVFNILPKSGELKIENITAVTISGLSTSATFDLAKAAFSNEEKGVIELQYERGAAGSVQASAIVFPTTVVPEFLLELTYKDGKKESFNVKSKENHTKGTKYLIEVQTAYEEGGDEGEEPTPEPTPEEGKWMELPVVKLGANQVYVEHPLSNGKRNYTILYDNKERIALWVAYPLHKSHMGSLKRPSWSSNPSALIPMNSQADLKKSYPAYPAYNRGHQIANSDRAGIREAQKMTFYYTNSMPQEPDFNGGTWNNLEQDIQKWAKSATTANGNNDTVYVVTGATITTPNQPKVKYTPDNSGKDCAVPIYCFKAVAKQINGEFYTIAYNMPNVKPAKGDRYQNYQMSVTELEELTGYTFFPGIDKATKDKIDPKGKW